MSATRMGARSTSTARGARRAGAALGGRRDERRQGAGDDARGAGSLCILPRRRCGGRGTAASRAAGAGVESTPAKRPSPWIARLPAAPACYATLTRGAAGTKRAATPHAPAATPARTSPPTSADAPQHSSLHIENKAPRRDGMPLR